MNPRGTLILLTSIAAASISAARAQVPIADVCNSVFSQGIRDNWYLFTEREQFESYQSRLCQAKFSSYSHFQSASASLGLNIPLAEGLLGLTGASSEKSSEFNQNYEKFCMSTYFAASDHLRYQSYVSQVSSALTQSWNKCQELYWDGYLKGKGVFVVVTPMGSTEQFVARVVIRSEQTGNVTIAGLNPDDSVSCTRGGAPVGPSSTITIREFSLTCRKDPTAEIAFSVETNFGQSNEVRVPAGVQRLAQLLGDLEVLRSAFQAQGGELEKVKERLVNAEQLLASRALLASGYPSNVARASVPGDPNSQWVNPITNPNPIMLVCAYGRPAIGIQTDGKGGFSALCSPMSWLDDKLTPTRAATQ